MRFWPKSHILFRTIASNSPIALFNSALLRQITQSHYLFPHYCVKSPQSHYCKSPNRTIASNHPIALFNFVKSLHYCTISNPPIALLRQIKSLFISALLGQITQSHLRQITQSHYCVKSPKSHSLKSLQSHYLIPHYCVKSHDTFNSALLGQTIELASNHPIALLRQITQSHYCVKSSNRTI